MFMPQRARLCQSNQFSVKFTECCIYAYDGDVLHHDDAHAHVYGLHGEIHHPRAQCEPEKKV